MNRAHGRGNLSKGIRRPASGSPSRPSRKRAVPPDFAKFSGAAKMPIIACSMLSRARIPGQWTEACARQSLSSPPLQEVIAAVVLLALPAPASRPRTACPGPRCRRLPSTAFWPPKRMIESALWSMSRCCAGSDRSSLGRFMRFAVGGTLVHREHRARVSTAPEALSMCLRTPFHRGCTTGLTRRAVERASWPGQVVERVDRAVR